MIILCHFDIKNRIWRYFWFQAINLKRRNLVFKLKISILRHFAGPQIINLKLEVRISKWGKPFDLLLFQLFGDLSTFALDGALLTYAVM